MTDIKLFSLSSKVSELPSTSVTFEKELQTLIEQNMATFFGITFLKSEFPITNGRIDSLGVDENNCPVIFEYKRSTNENVINQGLFYLDWLMDHRADFKWLVMDILGAEKANMIEWDIPCVICIASDFTKFDEHAVNQMQRNIKLVKYKKFGKDLILFEHLNAPVVKPMSDPAPRAPGAGQGLPQKTFLQKFEAAEIPLRNVYSSIADYIISLGDDVTENQLKHYVAFKKIRNIACVEIHQSKILIHLAIDPHTVEIQKDFTKDMTNTGHFGTGDLQVTIKSMADFEKAKPLIDRAYNEG
jgi:predicted transport protein